MLPFTGLARKTFILFVYALFAMSSASTYATIHRGAHPIKGRYLVILKSDGDTDVDKRADAAVKVQGGRKLFALHGTLRAFGYGATPAQADAMSQRVDVAAVIEDRELFTAAPVDSSVMFGPQPTQPEALPSNCTFDSAAGYWTCEPLGATLFWNLDRTDNLGPLYTDKNAYAFATTGSGVRVYVIDFGIYKNHEQFAVGQVETGANMAWDPDANDPIGTPAEERPFVNRDASPPTFPCNNWGADLKVGHGTAVASVVAGRETGVAKNATLIPIKVGNCWTDSLGHHHDPSREKISMLATARGLDYVLRDVRAKQVLNPSIRGIVSMSIFEDPTDFDPSSADPETGLQYQYGQEVCEGSAGYVNCISAIENMIQQLIQAGIPVIVSANNQSNVNCRTSPARMGYGNEAGFYSPERTITVGGTMYSGPTAQIHGTYTDKRWSGSGDLTNPGSNYGPCVSIYAPAWNLRVADIVSASSYRTQYNYGTSFAQPLVAGVVARMLERNPSWTVNQVWQALKDRANQRSGVPDFDPSGTFNNRLLYMPATE